MDDYIKRKDAYSACCYETPECYTARKDIKALPSADVAPIRHGRWVECTSSPHWKCSMCGVKASIWFDEFDEICEWLSDYCPNCGAKMDGDDDDVTG